MEQYREKIRSFIEANLVVFEDEAEFTDADNIFEMGSDLSKDRVAPNHYIRDWIQKLEKIINTNMHLFMDDYYWSTEGDRQVVMQVQSGIPFHDIEIDEEMTRKKRELIESIPKDAIITVWDDRIVKSDDEARLLLDILEREIARKRKIRDEYKKQYTKHPKEFKYDERLKEEMKEIRKDITNMRRIRDSTSFALERFL